jgi:hypothetical protein
VTAYRLRWVLLLLALACVLAGLWWIAGPLLYGDADIGGAAAAPIMWWLPTALLNFVLEVDSESTAYGIHLAIFLGGMLLIQWMFLRPRRGWTVRLGEAARPMRAAVLGAAFMAMMLTVGSIATVLELVDSWDDVIDNDWVVPAAAVMVWVVWALVFYAYWRKGTRFEQLRTMAHGLIVGSILELIVASGVFIWKSDDDNCWCARGSYAGLVFGATVMIWAFGPGLLFLFLREARYHRNDSP